MDHLIPPLFAGFITPCLFESFRLPHAVLSLCDSGVLYLEYCITIGEQQPVTSLLTPAVNSFVTRMRVAHRSWEFSDPNATNYASEGEFIGSVITVAAFLQLIAKASFAVAIVDLENKYLCAIAEAADPLALFSYNSNAGPA